MLNKIEITCLVLIAAILGGVVFAAFNFRSDFEDFATSPLLRFSSLEELKGFVTSGQQNYNAHKGEYYAVSPMPVNTQAFSTSERSTSQDDLSGGDFSSTNIQVEGVDEIDFVKADGAYLYMVSGTTVFIVKAYPAEAAAIVSKISMNASIAGLFIAENRLVVVEGGSDYYYMETARGVAPYGYSLQSSVKVYDVTDKADPILGPNVTVDGNYFDSRMIGDYVYVVANKWVYNYESEIVLPKIIVNNRSIEVPATDIYYSNVSDSSYSYMMVVAVNVQDFSHAPIYKTFLQGSASNMYASIDNIYLTQWDWDYSEDGGTRTRIHRIHVAADSIEYMASGSVPGYVLNQFSMDEYNGYFRIATQGSGWRTTFSGGASQNNVYVLDMDLRTVGSIEGLAPGESIHSARFVGKRGYLVTFKKVDPLFVIDLENPTNPSVLGYLKVTGYSDYLQPYDETHLIGIGKETVAAEEGDFAWYQGVKISLFDVSDVEHPLEIGKYEIGDRGTSSPVLNDHKALLFDRVRNLLVLPIELHEIDPAQYGGEVPPYAYGELVWQGAYIFNVSVAGGLSLRGRVTHLRTDIYDYEHYVKRALYIGNVLFTISDKTIKMNNLDTLEEIKQIQLP